MIETLKNLPQAFVQSGNYQYGLIPICTMACAAFILGALDVLIADLAAKRKPHVFGGYLIVLGIIGAFSMLYWMMFSIAPANDVAMTKAMFFAWLIYFMGPPAAMYLSGAVFFRRTKPVAAPQ